MLSIGLTDMQRETFLQSNTAADFPLTICPVCRMTWVTPGLRCGDQYECKGCQARFVIGQPGDVAVRFDDCLDS